MYKLSSKVKPAKQPRIAPNHWAMAIEGEKMAMPKYIRSRGVRYIDKPYRLSIYRHILKISISISISIRSLLKISISIKTFIEISISISISIRTFLKISISISISIRAF